MEPNKPKCPECGGELTVLFTSVVCDRCHPPITVGTDDEVTEDCDDTGRFSAALVARFEEQLAIRCANAYYIGYGYSKYNIDSRYLTGYDCMRHRSNSCGCH